MSIGGWTGSQYFSTAVATAENRTAFVKSVVGLASKYELDGIEFECVIFPIRSNITRLILFLSWEYPNRQGVGCNTISPNDSTNFLSFLQELRTDPTGAQLILSAAVGITPFMDSGGTPMKDVAAFAQVLDHIGKLSF